MNTEDELRPRTVATPYNEEDRWLIDTIADYRELEIALIRERLLRCDPLDLHRLIQRVNKLLDELPNTPLTEEQRLNARRLTNGFKSLFHVGLPTT
jgi:hypothetical protein